MKKHILILTLIVSTGFALFGISANNAKATSQTAETTEVVEKTYILTDYHGRIALFESNNQIPIKVFDVFTSTLPEKDIELITKGIKVNYNEVPKTLEEYLS